MSVETVPLSVAQRALGAVPETRSGGPVRHLAVDVRLPREADERVVRLALGALAARHAPLRTTVPPAGVEGLPVQRVHRRLPLDLRVVELGMIPERDRPGLVGRLAAGAAQRPFDLGAGPLWRALLLRAPARGHLHLVAHRLVFDGHSAAVLRAELAETVAAALAGRPARLPELPSQYPDFALRQQSAEVREHALAHWRSRLAGAPDTAPLPWDRPPPAVADLRGARREFALPGLVPEVRRAARRAGTDPALVLLAGFAALLHRWGGRTDLLIGVPAADRPPELRGLIGCFETVLPLRVRVPPDASGRRLLDEVRAVSADALAHRDAPLDLLPGVPPVRVAFTADPVADLAGAVGGTSGPPHRRAAGAEHRDAAPRFDLALALTERGDGYLGRFEYRTALLDPRTVDRLVLHWRALLPALLADPDRPVGELPATGG
ncbi:hypothetical protein HUT16_01745 [Kitasatospora sp. NA04385]|uniref:condensation domain-containing protein n=1 Tax=Kitasatospora sp. NA04385 TaxID=2742135 RepID=UPI0015921BBA|nr:condensation domain-containing protein [Kitasatospora sp. NA04385]QKW17948.1 hypothetical protein HUT16_01745 [Kitasatospora sp. NA04385]